MLAALHVLALLGTQDKPLSELKQAYSRYEASGEINSQVDDQAGRTAAVVEAFADESGSTDDLDGVTVELSDGSWFNIHLPGALRPELQGAAGSEELAQGAAARVPDEPGAAVLPPGLGARVAERQAVRRIDEGLAAAR